ncbi:hypothetical protein CEXT_161121 [Caerostris extrusa]|uniref:Uncharacterized protein n=1 Tax=Caerostris extrusa TaxID=172846 RepID=A0AAV4TFY4_CAEEX|nr:hypothetical protein CEXT_161121 [Caerostris extrusa]
MTTQDGPVTNVTIKHTLAEKSEALLQSYYKLAECTRTLFGFGVAQMSSIDWRKDQWKSPNVRALLLGPRFRITGESLPVQRDSLIRDNASIFQRNHSGISCRVEKQFVVESSSHLMLEEGVEQEGVEDEIPKISPPGDVPALCGSRVVDTLG